MLKNKIVDLNELLAEFMDAKMTNLFGENDFNYDKDWNKLMSVVEKIESLGYGMEITPASILVYDMKKAQFNSRYESLILPIYYRLKDVTKQMHLWHACFNFVKWYIENKKETI